MDIDHDYAVVVEWTGNQGSGTSGYKSYGRDHIVSVEGKPPLLGSSDRAFFGDRDRWNPEDELVAALSQCHMLSYLHVAQRSGVVVQAYTDAAAGTMRQVGDGGHFTEVVLHPVVTISAGDPALALELHHEAHELCFIASSVNFPVRVEAQVVVGDTD